MRPDVLVRKFQTYLKRPSPTKAYRSCLAQVESTYGSLAGKRILDIGCDSKGYLIKAAHNNLKANEAVGLNLTARDIELADGCRFEAGDIRNTNFADDYFDLAVSFSAFEHIHDLSSALKETYRILAPGGVLYADFGPIWSSPCGHHLWADGHTYWNIILPSWCHLLMTRQEVRDYAHQQLGLSEERSEFITSYIFNPDDTYGFSQNKLMFEDYKRIAAESYFETLAFKGTNNSTLDALYPTTMSTIRSMREAYPDNQNILYTGIFMLLQKI